MRKILLFAIIFCLFNHSVYSLTGGNSRSEFAGKFIIMRELASKCRSNNEKTGLTALNALRDVFFRNMNSMPQTYSIAGRNTTIAGMIEGMNNDVDRIQTGFIHLENSLKVSDPFDAADKYMNELLKYLLVSEISLVVANQSFFSARDRFKADIEQGRKFIISAMYLPPSDNPDSDLIVLDRIENIIDMAGYIYNEQIQWLMNASFALQNLDIKSFQINGDSVFSGFSVGKPPRIFIPLDQQHYTLRGNSR